MGAREAEPRSDVFLHPRCLIHSRCPENEGLEQGETVMEHKLTGMNWLKADPLLSPMGRNQETVTGAKTPKLQQKTVNAETEEKMRKTYTKGVKSKRKTEDIIMLKM